ncbi:MAG: prepilin-type N-terminal cleavage/methylation domain-containing protein [Fibrobacter sp.]|nr:prepilin-type N-terminal cleavage/methylation domain-containing protein [Fibrobacter sp.]
MHSKSLLGSAMEKRGFSLVELMVVVVILILTS